MADEEKPKERKEKKKVAEPAAEGGAAAPEKKAKVKKEKAEPPPEVAAPVAPKPHTVSTKVPKLQKKNKSRLPRRQKKALQTAEAARNRA